MPATSKIAPCLWFDHQAEEAANFYVSVFRNSKITSVSRYSNAGQEIHRRPPGSVMVVAFELEGQPFTARSTITGTSCHRAATRRPSSAAG